MNSLNAACASFACWPFVLMRSFASLDSFLPKSEIAFRALSLLAGALASAHFGLQTVCVLLNVGVKSLPHTLHDFDFRLFPVKAMGLHNS